jgi:hypothetical protein
MADDDRMVRDDEAVRRKSGELGDQSGGGDRGVAAFVRRAALQARY